MVDEAFVVIAISPDGHVTFLPFSTKAAAKAAVEFINSKKGVHAILIDDRFEAYDASEIEGGTNGNE